MTSVSSNASRVGPIERATLPLARNQTGEFDAAVAFGGVARRWHEDESW